MNALTVFVFLTLAIVLQATTPRRQTGKTHPTIRGKTGTVTGKPKPTTRVGGTPVDVSDPHIQDLARAAVANYSLSATKVCLKHSYTLVSVEEALFLHNNCKCYRITLTMVYNSNCPFTEAKVCKIEPNSKTDKKYNLVVEVNDFPNPRFTFLEHPIDTTDC